jgi:hypothetical protein
MEGNVPEWMPMVVMAATLIIFNAAIIKLLQVAFGPINFRAALREKDPKVLQATAAAVVATAAAAPAGASPPADPTAADPTSYSRIAGAAGAIVLACFLWGLGNVILYKAFDSGGAAAIRELLQNVGIYFLAGASLFAPYAFNQLKAAFGA